METKQSVIKCDLSGAITTADNMEGWLSVKVGEMRKPLHLSPAAFEGHTVGEFAAVAAKALADFEAGKAKREAKKAAKAENPEPGQAAPAASREHTSGKSK